jgi:hypothetical protein
MNKYVQPRSFADPDAAARKIVEIANSIETVQDGRIHVEKINAPFLYQLKGSPVEYGAGMKRAIENGWLKMHESGTFVRFTQAGADLFAGDLRIRRMVSHTPMSSPSIAPRKAALAGAIRCSGSVANLFGGQRDNGRWKAAQAPSDLNLTVQPHLVSVPTARAVGKPAMYAAAFSRAVCPDANNLA